MGTIVSVLFLSFALQFIPFFGLGWLLKGTSPWITCFIGLLVYVFVFHVVDLHWFAFIIMYFVAIAWYCLGAKVRTGKNHEELLSGQVAKDET